MNPAWYCLHFAFAKWPRSRIYRYIYIYMNLATQRITLITEAISKTGGRRRVANGRHPWRKSNEWQDQSQAAELLDQMEEEGGGGGG